MTGTPPPETAQAAFRRGLSRLEARSYQEAATCFQAAIDEERQAGSNNLRPRYVSYLGLAMTLARGRSVDALRLCEQAVKREFFDPDLFCNLGIVYLRNLKRGRAFQAFQRGLKLKPNHRRILEEIERYDARSQPTFGFLPRAHPLNRLMGQVRARLRSLFHGDAASEA